MNGAEQELNGTARGSDAGRSGCPFPRLVLRFAAGGWDDDLANRGSDRLDTAVATLFTRKMYRAKPTLRETVAPWETSARRVAAALGLADAKAVGAALRRWAARGVLRVHRQLGARSSYSLDYAGLCAERGNFVNLSAAELDVLMFGDRRHQRALARILLATAGRDRDEARIRLEDFRGSRSSIEQALADLEAAGLVKVHRSWSGNRYRRTRQGALPTSREQRRVALVQAVLARVPGRPRSRRPVRSATRAVRGSRKPPARNQTATPGQNRSKGGGDFKQTVGAKSNDKKQRKNSQRSTREELQQQSRPHAAGAVAGARSSSANLERGLSAVELQLVERLHGAGVGRRLSVDVAPVIVHASRLDWAEAWIAARSAGEVLNASARLAAALRSALKGDWWEPPVDVEALRARYLDARRRWG